VSEPRNVTPGHEEGSDEFRARYYTERAEEPEWMAWKWANRGRGFPWLGVLLVLIGLALLVQYFVAAVSAGTLVLLAIGIAFLAGELIEDLALLGPAGDDVPGLASTSLALGFLFIWLVGYVRGRRSSWPLWGAALFGLIGVAQLSGRLAGIPELGALWPVAIIAAGLLILLASRRSSAA